MCFVSFLTFVSFYFQENAAFFVMTNVLVTPEQTQSTCEEVREFNLIVLS